MAILHTENLSFSYPNSNEKALKNINISIESGEFIVVCGKSGCGKTTLLRMMKKELSPSGEKSGEVFFDGEKLDGLNGRISASQIGFVMQDPISQIVTDKVWHELAFPLENLGIESQIIRRRVAEIASFFGIQDWFLKNTNELSGGQVQLLNIASAMILQPKVLILDEPTSQLDPTSSSDLMTTVKKLNNDLGITVILAEHRLEEAFQIADRVLVMKNSEVIAFDKPRNIGNILKKRDENHSMLSALPAAMRISERFSFGQTCPLTVKEGREFVRAYFKKPTKESQTLPHIEKGEKVLEVKDLFFRYDAKEKDILNGVNLSVFSGETLCILGGNGTGKTTFLNVLSGVDKAYRGSIELFGKKVKAYRSNSLYRNCLAYLPQNPASLFLKDSVKKDLEDVTQDKELINSVLDKTEIRDFLDRHPFDLSGGEMQRCAIAKVLLTNPKILLMDEPTKGIDPYFKKKLGDIIKRLNSNSVTIITVTHDVEFSSQIADRCALFFGGDIVSIDEPKNFFSQNNYYTTTANRIVRDYFPMAVTVEDAVKELKANINKETTYLTD